MTGLTLTVDWKYFLQLSEEIWYHKLPKVTTEVIRGVSYWAKESCLHESAGNMSIWHGKRDLCMAFNFFMKNSYIKLNLRYRCIERPSKMLESLCFVKGICNSLLKLQTLRGPVASILFGNRKSRSASSQHELLRTIIYVSHQRNSL